MKKFYPLLAGFACLSVTACATDASDGDALIFLDDVDAVDAESYSHTINQKCTFTANRPAVYVSGASKLKASVSYTCACTGPNCNHGDYFVEYVLRMEQTSGATPARPYTSGPGSWSSGRVTPVATNGAFLTSSWYDMANAGTAYVVTEAQVYKYGAATELCRWQSAIRKCISGNCNNTISSSETGCY